MLLHEPPVSDYLSDLVFYCSPPCSPWHFGQVAFLPTHQAPYRIAHVLTGMLAFCIPVGLAFSFLLAVHSHGTFWGILWPLFWNINPCPQTDSSYVSSPTLFILLSIYCPNPVLVYLSCLLLAPAPKKALIRVGFVTILFTSTSKTVRGIE